MITVTISCKDMASLLGDYVEQNLDGDILGEVQAHLDRCVSCRTYARQLELTLEVLKEVGDVPQPVETSSMNAAMAAFGAWDPDGTQEVQSSDHPGERAAASPSFWDLLIQPRHLVPALKLGLLVAPVVTFVNHTSCVLSLNLGWACVGQSMAMALLPFGAALYTSVRGELGRVRASLKG